MQIHEITQHRQLDEGLADIAYRLGAIGEAAHMRQRGQRGGGDIAQRKAIGRRRGQRGHADRTTRAAAILHHHRLAEKRRHASGEGTAGQVGHAAGREGHRQGDRAAGKALRRQRPGS